jgi:integrase
MPRKVRDANLETKTARGKLKPHEPAHKPYYRLIEAGLHLGYRRRAGEPGMWVVRRYAGEGRYVVENLRTEDGHLVMADDYSDPDGKRVLTFGQAQERAKAFRPGGGKNTGPYTVQQACERYVEYLRAEKKTADDAEGRLKKHILPRIGEIAVVKLTKKDLEKCQRAMVHRDPDDPEIERRSKDSANRVMSSLKAALNLAFNDDDNNIPSDSAWRKVKPFKGVGRARQVHLDVAQSNRLINATSGKFRWLVTAALLTGARPPHEFRHCRVRDFRADLRVLSIGDGKTGGRDVVLTEEAVRFFQSITAGRKPDELLLPKDNGTAWGKSHQARPMAEAVRKAHLPEDCTIYACRHTYASQSILRGMNLKLLAENMGTSIRMLELHYGKFIAQSRQQLIEESGFKLGLVAENVTPLHR